MREYPCGGLHRREFAATALSMIGAATAAAQEPKAGARPAAPTRALGVPGPYPGRVVEARNPAMIRGRQGPRGDQDDPRSRDRGADRRRRRGRSLAVASSSRATSSGSRSCPTAIPLAHTSHELVLEVIDGLKSAGVKPKDILVFDRYRQNSCEARIPRDPPRRRPLGRPDARRLGPRPTRDEFAGQRPDRRLRPRRVHRDEPRPPRATTPRTTATSARTSGLLVTRRVNKLVLLPVLKDHGSAGVTGALKNMSHGLVNNVSRSHSTPDTNACNQFIPAGRQPPDHPQEVRPAHHGRHPGGVPGGAVRPENPSGAGNTTPCSSRPTRWRSTTSSGTSSTPSARRWACRPSAPSAGSADPEREGFDIRQPQHIPLAGNLGLGIFDLKSPSGRRFSIDHRVLNVT